MRPSSERGLMPDGTWSPRLYMSDNQWTISKACSHADHGLDNAEHDTLTDVQCEELLLECFAIRREEVARRERSGELAPTTATVPPEYLGPCVPPLGVDEEQKAYLATLKEGDRVIEHGGSAFQGRLGTVTLSKTGDIGVTWDRFPGTFGQMSTSITWGCRLYDPPRISRMVCKTCGERPELSDAWRDACVATSTEDPIPCYFCGGTYERDSPSKTYPIMDCRVPAHIERKPNEPT